MGYIDLYLLHSPYGGKQKRLECWRAVEDAIHEGEVKCGGVSNFGVKHVSQLPLSSPFVFENNRADEGGRQLQELLDSKPKILPAVNQIEIHPFNTQIRISTFCASHNITIQAYAPLAKAMRFSHPVVKSLSKKYGCTPAQLLLRWGLQKGYCVLPKSVKRERIVENGDIGNFEIEEEDVRKMGELDEGLVTDWDPTDAD